MPNNPILGDFALQYAGIGWYVFPIKPDTKRPATLHGHRDATLDTDQITSWWTENPDYLIGVWCRASGFIVLDVDGEKGLAKLAELESKHGSLRKDVMAKSKNGLHILLCDPGTSNIEDLISDIVGNLGGQGVIDVKCNGYFIVEPSPNYEWLFPFDFNNPPVPPDVPEAWVSILVKQPEVPREPPPVMDADLAARVDKGRTLLERFVTRQSPNASLISDVLRGEGGLGCKTGNQRVGKIAYTIGAECPNIGADACQEIMSRTIAQIITNSTSAQPEAQLYRQAEKSYNNGAANAPPVPLPNTNGISHLRIASYIPEIRAKSNLPVIYTPWLNFNEATGGLELNSMTLAVGYQGSGKSSQAAQLAAYHARGAPVIYYLGEMGGRIFAARIVGQALKRSWRDVLRGKVSDEEMHAVLDPLHLFVVPAQLTAEEAVEKIVETIEHVKELNYSSPMLMVIDYVQLLGTVGKDMRQATINAVRILQSITETENVATWMLSQGSRVANKRIQTGTPDSIDLVDTGAETAELERAATVMFALSYKQKNDARVHDVTMDIGKRRFGGPTKLAFQYDGETGLFTAKTEPIKTLVVDQDAEDDAAVIARVQELAGQGIFYTKSKLRDLVPDVPDKRVRASLARLIPNKLYEGDAYGPAPLHKKLRDVVLVTTDNSTSQLIDNCSYQDPALSGIKISD